MDSTTTIGLLKITSIALPLALSGYSFSASHINVTNLYNLPLSKSAPIFATVFRQGGKLMVPAVLVAASSSSYLAYTLTAQRALWAATGVFPFAILPFTSVVMIPGINRVLKVADSSEADRELYTQDEYRELMRKWVGQNYVRALLLFAGGMVGLVGTLL